MRCRTARADDGPAFQPGNFPPAALRLCTALLLALAAYDLAFLAMAAWRSGNQRFGDFFALWSFAGYASEHGADALYDPAALHSFQRRLDPGFDLGYYSLGYPPSMLLLLWPLWRLKLAAAFLAWIGLTGLLYAAATLGRDWRSRCGLALLVAPATLIQVDFGQTGFLSAALLLAGLQQARARPILAGVLFGVLTCKPQLGLLVPVALVAAGLWRCAAAACATLALLVIASSALLGPSAWLQWADAAPRYWAMFSANRGPLDHLMPTVGATLLWFGPADAVVQAAQLAVALAVVAALWAGVRRAGIEHAATALPVAAFLVTPYAFAYDLPMLTAGVVLYVRRHGAQASAREIAVAALAICMPIEMLMPNAPPLEAPLVAALFTLMTHRALTLPRRPGAFVDLSASEAGPRPPPGSAEPPLDRRLA